MSGEGTQKKAHVEEKEERKRKHQQVEEEAEAEQERGRLHDLADVLLLRKQGNGGRRATANQGS